MTSDLDLMNLLVYVITCYAMYVVFMTWHNGAHRQILATTAAKYTQLTA
jgi:hypothetical protein